MFPSMLKCNNGFYSMWLEIAMAFSFQVRGSQHPDAASSSHKITAAISLQVHLLIFLIIIDATWLQAYLLIIAD
jgi:uncharacterized membrane protein YbaN (DUF454 family)